MDKGKIMLLGDFQTLCRLYLERQRRLSTFRIKMFVFLVGNYFSTEKRVGRMSVISRVVVNSVYNIMKHYSPSFSWPGVRRLCKKDDVVLGLNECSKSFAQRRLWGPLLSHLKNR